VGEPDEPNTPGWQIHQDVFPKEDDVIIDKEGADPFSGTNLQVELTNREIDQIVLVGMQTELCIAATVEEAAKRGFFVILVEDGHTTFDWDKLTAVDAIEKFNKELATVAMLQKAQDVKFR
jgi:nicotinamidase-related amidase